jgi:hypothetical protein
MDALTKISSSIRTLTKAEMAAVDGGGATWPFVRQWYIAMGMDAYEVALRDFAAELGYDLADVTPCG